MLATLSLAQHKDFDNAARRVAHLEELLEKAQEENAHLQSRLQMHLAAARDDSVKDDDNSGDHQEGRTGGREEGKQEGGGREAGGNASEEIAAPVAGRSEQAAGDSKDEVEIQGRKVAKEGYRGTIEEGQEFARKWEIASQDLQKIRCIGRGAAGAVYEGRWCGGAVAIKVYVCLCATTP